MAKPLNKPQPSSSVINFLEPHVGAAAISRVYSNEESEMLPTPITEQISSPNESIRNIKPSRQVNRQFKLQDEVDNILKQLVDVFSDATGVDIKMTEVLVGLLRAAEHGMPHIEHAATKISLPKRPKNDPLNFKRKDDFIKEISRALVLGMRESGAMK